MDVAAEEEKARESGIAVETVDYLYSRIRSLVLNIFDVSDLQKNLRC